MKTTHDSTPVAAPEGSRDHPILFSAPMVIAILAGRKTQTRRIVKPQPEAAGFGRNCIVRPYCTGTAWPLAYYERRGVCWNSSSRLCCPYGSPGDRLWVRETFQMHSTGAGIRVTYRADGLDAWIEPPPTWCGIPDDNHWRPSIFMPRWASRITLEIADVRVERLKDISNEDCFAEGLPADSDKGNRTWYGDLWESINGKGSWDLNPRVWVVEFKRLNPD